MSGKRECLLPECDRLHYARGWCRSHYERWTRHGDPRGGTYWPLRISPPPTPQEIHAEMVAALAKAEEANR